MDAAHRWITDAIHPFEYDVASLVPPVFEAYARVFHPAYQIGHPVSWKTLAEANNRVAHPAMEWGSLVGSWDLRAQPGLWDQRPDTGRLPVPTAEALSRILRHYSQSDKAMYALWNGYGEAAIANADLIELPNRPMYVINGSSTMRPSRWGYPVVPRTYGGQAIGNGAWPPTSTC